MENLWWPHDKVFERKFVGLKKAKIIRNGNEKEV